MILGTNWRKRKVIIEMFAELSELRGWLWETHFMGRKNTVDEYNNVLDYVRKRLDYIGNATGLHRVED